MKRMISSALLILLLNVSAAHPETMIIRTFSGIIACDSSDQVKHLIDWQAANPQALHIDWDENPGCGYLKFPKPFDQLGMPTIISEPVTYRSRTLQATIVKMQFRWMPPELSIQFGLTQLKHSNPEYKI